MHRRFLKSLATVMGAAALVIAPIALIAPSAQAETLTVPDDVVEHDANAGTNDEAYWVTYLEEERGITGATCKKTNGPNTETFTIPDAPAGTMYVLAVTKAGSGDEANWVFYDPKAGDVLTAVDEKEISHYILCTVPKKTTTPPGTTPPHSTPPVVDTDRVSTGSGANLGLYGAAAALLVGAAAIVAGRRRQGAHR